MRWPGNTVSVLDAAIASARAGEPTVVAIEGAAGMGKSALLRECVAGLDGFHVLRGFGEESRQNEPLQLLREWSAIPDGTAPPQHTLQAARLLAQVIDRWQLIGPVAIVIDDLQWVDRESTDALAALLQRAAGDRLLVVTAFRPLGRRHESWRRILDGGAALVTLDGLDAAATAALVGTVAPDAPPALAEQLREHTGGNPLYIGSLLREHSVADLIVMAAAGSLPAPAVLADRMDARVMALDPDAGHLLHALAVLGDMWSDLGTAAAVGDVPDFEAAAQVLREDGLARVDRSTPAARIRISHSVIRAAVYDGIPAAERRRLHAAAAARAQNAGERLMHRIASSIAPDEGLAHDLDQHADALHERGQYREAGRYRRLAAHRSPKPADAERRSLDADFEAILARDLDDVELDPMDAAASPHRRVVEAERLSATKQWVRGARLLDPLGALEFEALTPVNAFRAHVLRGWSYIAGGRDPSTAIPDLEAAMHADADARDRALRGVLTFAYGQAQQPISAGDLWGFESERATQRAALAASPDGVVRLSWRGSVYSLTGMTAEAIGDLSVVTGRIGDGDIDFGDGVFHSLLGFAQWMAGEWRRASISIALPLVSPLVAPHPIALAMSPLAAVVAGDSGESVETAIARSREARLAGPLPAAIHAGDMADVSALAYSGTDAMRERWRSERITDFGEPLDQTRGAIPYLWFLIQGLAAAWAHDADAVETWAGHLTRLEGSPWRPAAIAWLRALALGTRGEPNADALLAVGALPGLSSLDAIRRTQTAVATAAEGHPAAGRARAEAEASLAALGPSAVCALPRPFDSSGLSDPTYPAASDASSDPLAPLSDREREVVALLLEGLSYAQIAKELYVTRSTVAFHLSNAYAKTSTTSRHELVQLVRTDA